MHQQTSSKVVQFLNPANVLVAGCTGSGKTHWVINCIKNSDWIVQHTPTEIYWFYGVAQENVFKALQNNPIPVHFQQGIPDFELLNFDRKSAKILVLDDLISSPGKQQNVLEEVFLYYTHHYNFLTFLLTQNLFHNSRVFRGISLNSH